MYFEVWINLEIKMVPNSRQEATCKHRIQFSVQNPWVFNINIIMYRNWKKYGDSAPARIIRF